MLVEFFPETVDPLFIHKKEPAPGITRDGLIKFQWLIELVPLIGDIGMLFNGLCDVETSPALYVLLERHFIHRVIRRSRCYGFVLELNDQYAIFANDRR